MMITPTRFSGVSIRKEANSYLVTVDADRNPGEVRYNGQVRSHSNATAEVLSRGACNVSHLQGLLTQLAQTLPWRERGAFKRGVNNAIKRYGEQLLLTDRLWLDPVSEERAFRRSRVTALAVMA